MQCSDLPRPSNSALTYVWAVACMLLWFYSFPSASTAAGCPGDCDDDGEVTVNELIVGINIFFDPAQLASCTALDSDASGAITINELLEGVKKALSGCEASTPGNTQTPTVTAEPSRTPSPSPTTGAMNATTHVQVFRSANGTLYFAVSVDRSPADTGLGAQITSLAFSHDQVTASNEPLLPTERVLSSFSSAKEGKLPDLRRIKRTRVISLASNRVVLDYPPDSSNGEFEPAARGGDGLLTLPGYVKQVTVHGGSDTESVYDVTVASPGVLYTVPAATVTLIQRYKGDAYFREHMLVFPMPVGDVVQSSGPICSAAYPVPCDPIIERPVACQGGTCSGAGGETVGQKVTLDDTLYTRVGNEGSQGNSVDGFFLRAGKDVIVFILEPGEGPLALNASASGFFVEGTCANDGGPCSSEQDCPGMVTCSIGVSDRRVIGAIGGGSSVEEPPAAPTPTPTPTVPVAFLDVGFGDALPGENVRIPILLRKNGAAVATASAEIIFDSMAFSINPPADCRLGSQILDKQLTAQKLCSGALESCRVDADCNDTERCEVLSVGAVGLNPSLIPDGLLLTCDFTVSPSASAADYALDTVRVLTNPEGNRIPARGTDGYIAVGSPAPATPTPSSTTALTAQSTRTPSPGPVLQFVEVLRDEVRLDGVSFVALSPDGQYAYAGSPTDSALTVLERDLLTDALSFVAVYQDGFEGVDGLNDVSSAVISPDGNHLYATSRGDRSISAFRRDLVSGTLTFLELHKQGIAGVSGLNGSAFAAISPDGMHVYVAGDADDAIALFSRDKDSGRLTFEFEVQKDGVRGVDGLQGTNAIVVAPDGLDLYATGYYEEAVAVFRRDAATGILTFSEVKRNGSMGVDGLRLPTSLALSPDGTHLYVIGRADSGSLAVFNRNHATGFLEFVEVKKDSRDGVDGLLGAISVAVSSDGKHVYAAADLDNAITVFGRNLNTGVLVPVEEQRNGLGGVDGLAAVGQIALSSDGSVLLAPSRLDNALAVFRRNTESGGLAFVEAWRSAVGVTDGLSAASAVAVSPDGSHVYVAGSADNAVAVFARDGGSGTFRFVGVQQEGIGGVNGLSGVQSLAVSSDGRNVYALSLFRVAVFRRDQTTGELRFLYSEGGPFGGFLGGSTAFVVPPDGRHLYVSTRALGVSVFARTIATGALRYVSQGTDVPLNTSGASASPDGRNLYFSVSDSLVVVERDSDTGSLQFIETHKDGENGVDGLLGAQSVSVSPDGINVYVCGTGDSAVAVFRRDPITGRLSFVQANSAFLPSAVIVSPDGTYVFVALYDNSAVSVFSRNLVTGALTFREEQRLGVSGVEGIRGVRALAMSPEGAQLMAAGELDNAVTVFSIAGP